MPWDKCTNAVLPQQLEFETHIKTIEAGVRYENSERSAAISISNQGKS
jgi:hypothetical protein